MILTLKEAKERGFVEHLKKRCVEMNLYTRTTNCLSDKFEGNIPIDYIWELVEKSEAELLKRINFGRKSLNEIKEMLIEHDLQLDTRLTDALKRELGAPIMADDPHEDWDLTSGAAVPTAPSPLLEGLQQKLDTTNAAIDQMQQEISEAKKKLTAHEDMKRSLEHVIKNFTTIALALS